MNERKAAQIAGRVYEAHKLGKITDSEASIILNKISIYFSTTQYYKHLDWLNFIQYNPQFYREK